MKAYTLKIRSGVERDSAGKKAGKGALIQEEKSGTLGVSQDQYLFQPVILNPHDSQGNHVTSDDGTYPTLRGCGGGGYQQGYVLQTVGENGDDDAYAVDTSHADQERDYKGGKCVIQPVGLDRYNQTTTGNKSPTLKTPQGGDDIPCVIEAVGVDMYNQDLTGDQSATIGVNCGASTGRNGVVYAIPVIETDPETCDEKITMVGSFYPQMKAESQCFRDDGISNTLVNGTNAGFQNAIVYGISSYESNAMKSDNPHSGIYEADTSRTLDLNGGNPACNQGGICVVQAYDIGEARLRNPSEYVEQSPTLTARCGTGGNNVPAVVYEKTENDE